MRFFEQLVPESGLICVARALPQGGFAHNLFENLYEAVDFIKLQDARGNTMYLAQSSYSETALHNHRFNQSLPKTLTTEERRAQRYPVRAQENVEFVRSFWFDIDCGETKPYPNQIEAVKALRSFCSQTGLPLPTIVNSGNGLYAHWFLDRDITGNVWRAHAQILKDVSAAFGFKDDTSRTADSASVLRPPGTTNRKHGAAKPVIICGELTAPINFDTFAQQLILLAKTKKISTTPLHAPKTPDLNSEFLGGLEGPPSSAYEIARRCAQIGHIKDRLGDVSEPMWYAALGVLSYTLESPQIVHDWSCGHPDYDPQKTDEKLARWTLPPTSCHKLSESMPALCSGCRHKDKIKSPIVLGRPEPVAIAAPEEHTIDPPNGFIREAKGISYIDEDGVAKLFYTNDFYPVSVAYDHSLGYETATFKHHLPHDGWHSFTVRSSAFQDGKSCLTILHDNHVQVVGKKEKALMVMYAESYLDKVRKSQRLGQLYSQMGWHRVNNELKFVLGSKIITKTGVDPAGLAQNIPEIAKSITPMGDPQLWSNATQLLGTEGMEPLAFALLAGAFGAPLLRFTGFAGAMLSMIGASGAGKTLIGYWVLSAYGAPDKLVLLRDDTRNMLISRLGLYGTLPLYVDEITNIEAMDLSDLVYRITQGRDKGRLTKNSTERGQINAWNTIALTSSNASLIDKLGFAKADAAAEINRVFEYRVNAVPQLTNEVATGIYRMLSQNYGGVGEAYIKWLVANTDRHTESIDKLAAQINALTCARPDERFWSAIAAVSIYGGMIAKNLGLIQFEIAPVMQWLVATIKNMRQVKGDYASDAVSLLGQFLDKHSAGIIIVNDCTKKHASLLREPHGPLVARLETDTLRLYISREVLRRDLYRNYGSYDQMKHELTRDRALLKHDHRKNLGAGTYLSGVQQFTWEINLKAPCLGHLATSLLSVVPDKKAVDE